MTPKELLKKLGILGVSLGLIASPLAFGEAEGGATEPSHEEVLDEEGADGEDGKGGQGDPNMPTEEDDKSSSP